MQYKLYQDVESMQNNVSYSLLKQITKILNIDWIGDYIDENGQRSEILEYFLEFIDDTKGLYYRLGDDDQAPFLVEQPEIHITPQGQDLRSKQADEVMTVKQLKELYEEYRNSNVFDQYKSYRRKEIRKELEKVGLRMIEAEYYETTQSYIDLID